MKIVLNLLLLIISNLGYWELLRRNTKVHRVFFPSLTIAFEVSVLFVAGLLNLLKETVVVLYLCGIIFLLYVLWKDRNVKFIREYFSFEYLFFAFCLIALIIYLKDIKVTHFDNFSHWAIAAKQIIMYDRFPNFQDTVILFQEYPLGSTIYIYFFCKVVAFSEGMMMSAQMIMLVSSIMPLFYYVKKDKVVAFILILIISNFFFVYSIEITELLVDTLLPLVSMCGLFYMYLYCFKREDDISYWLALPYLIQMVHIKNSGIFFAVVAAVIIIWSSIRNGKLKEAIILSVIPLITKILWSKHCDYVFVNADESMHAMRLGNFKNILKEKTVDDVIYIIKLVIYYAVTNSQVWICIVAMLCTAAIVYFFNKKYKNTWLIVLASAIFMFGFYMLGLIGMYIFSMPLKEAKVLGGVVRYLKTILITLIYVMAIAIIHTMSNNEKIIKKVALIAFMVIFTSALMLTDFGELRSVFVYRGKTARRDHIEELIEEYDIEKHSSYRILLDSYDSGYLFYLGEYMFETSDVYETVVNTQEDIGDVHEKYIIINNTANEEIMKWVKENYPDQYGNGVIITDNE